MSNFGCSVLRRVAIYTGQTGLAKTVKYKRITLCNLTEVITAVFGIQIDTYLKHLERKIFNCSL
jgi:hypothetical protein